MAVDVRTDPTRGASLGQLHSALTAVPARIRAARLGGGRLPYDVMKRAMDIGVSLVALVIGAPVLLLIAATVLIGSGRPVLYRANRVGRGGKAITVLKFRTMRRDSEAVLRDLLEHHPVMAEEFRTTYKLRDDPRLTRVGRFLRKTSLDELPQFWNVLRGNMTLVGPRPIVEDELTMYAQVPGGLEAYLAVKPGITGLWQVSGRSDVSYEERVQLDIDYVRTRSLSGDVHILVRTPAAAIHGHGAY